LLGKFIFFIFPPYFKILKNHFGKCKAFFSIENFLKKVKFLKIEKDGY